VIKLFVGLLKGAVIGGAVGYGIYAGHVGVAAWLACGLVGVLVGLLVGRPIWTLIRDKDATTVAAVLKMAFGFGVGVGLWALVAKAWSPSPELLVVPSVSTVSLLYWAPTLCAAVGAVYGAFVEVDDSVGHAPTAADGANKAMVAAKPKKK
jgi:hypothetical protein